MELNMEQEWNRIGWNDKLLNGIELNEIDQNKWNEPNRIESLEQNGIEIDK